MFYKEILELFQKIAITLPKPVYYIKKIQMLLIYVGGKWFMDKHKTNPPPFKRPILSKEAHKKEDYIKKSSKISSTLE